MPTMRAVATVGLWACGTAPADARGQPCGASCQNWLYPLIAVAVAVCLVLAGVYYLTLALGPRFGSWADARRGRVRKGLAWVALILAGFGALALISDLNRPGRDHVTTW